MKEPQEVPPTPDHATGILGEHLRTATRFAEHLADTGVTHGLIGPREVPRLWDRHVLNCAVVGELLPRDATVADVGSGAGLPGMVLAIVRPDVRLTLIEPMLRRVNWLEAVKDDLDLDNVEILRSRAEEVRDRRFDVVTSRAVARLDVLSEWSLPLLKAGGRMLALKGSSAQEEVDEAREQLLGMGGSSIEVLTCGDGVLDPPTVVVGVTVQDEIARPAKKKSAGKPRPHRAGSKRRKHRRKS